MEFIINIFINIGLPFLLIILAMITGSVLEKRHYKSIAAREETFAGIALLSHRKYPQKPVNEARLVTGEVVISTDHFKRFLAGLRNIFGGNVKSYETLVDRGRREAILRMKAQCPTADLICNVRLVTSSISKGAKNKAIGSVEVIAYGTAIWIK